MLQPEKNKYRGINNKSENYTQEKKFAIAWIDPEAFDSFPSFLCKSLLFFGANFCQNRTIDIPI